MEVITVPIRSAADTESTSRVSRNGLALPGPFGFSHQKLIADLAARYRLPSIGSTQFAHDGGLMDYGISGDYVDQFGQAVLRRPHSQRNEARRPPRTGADPVPFGDQPQNRQGPRPHDPGNAVGYRR
jgi:hypothetical protein